MGKFIFATVFVAFGLFADSYEIDNAHSRVEFKVKHLMIAKVTGVFKDYQGSFQFDEKSGKLSDIKVTIQVKSIDTSEKDRDKHLLSGDFFDVGKFQSIDFKSNGTIVKKGDTIQLEGDLTIRNITKKVNLGVTFNGIGKDPWGNTKAALEAKTKIKRKDFGLTWNKNLDGGGVLVGDDVEINIEGEAKKK